ncbi:MAG: tetratricopeptide repeat protein [bacterium]
MKIVYIVLLPLALLFLGVFILFLFKKFIHRDETRQLMDRISADKSVIEELEDTNELIRLASRLEGVGQFERAIKVWNRYLELEKNSSAGLLERGKAYYHLGVYQRALADLKKVLNSQEDPFPEVYLYLGRCYREKGNIRHALQYYSDYLKIAPENITVSFEVAATAREGRDFDEAKKIYERVREKGVVELYIQATLELIEMMLLDEDLSRAADYLKDLYRLDKRGRLNEKNALHTRYFHARLKEKRGDLQEALRLYQEVYKIQPDFMDVSRCISEHIDKIGGDDLLEEYVRASDEQFLQISQYIVDRLGYEIEQNKFNDDNEPTSLNITAAKKTGLWRQKKVLFAFKRWNYAISEWPLREFELAVKEAGCQDGYLVVAGGFKKAARNFASEKTHINLLGPENLVNYLRKYRKISMKEKNIKEE